MTAEQQLERSVLEGKERDELHAIAQALSVKTNTRTKKADMIDGILKATGVSVDSPPADKGATNGDGTAAANGDGAAPSTSRRRSAGSRSAAATATPDEGAATGSAPTAGPAGRAGGRAPVVHSFGPADDVGSDGGSVDLDDDFAEVAVSDSAGSNGQANGQQKEVSGSTSHEDTQGQTAGQQGGEGGRQPNQAGGNQQGNNRNNNRNNRNNNQNNNQNRTNQNNRNNQGGGNDDIGNRRSNRRRRGRDRQGGGGAEGDLQGAGGSQDQQYQGELIPVRGLLDLRDEGYGFLRCEGYLPSNKDVYVSISQARRFALRKGDSVEGFCRPAGSTEKYPALLQIDTVSSLDPEVARNRPRFEDLTPLFPDERLHLETPGDKENLTARIVDLLSPIGKGQRGLIVSPPRPARPRS